MTQAELISALPRLRRALGQLGEHTDDALLQDALETAQEKLLRYLNRDTLPGSAECLLIELAALCHLRNHPGYGRRSESYSEGQLSQSESYLTPEEFQEGEAALLRALAPYRQVGVGRKGS